MKDYTKTLIEKGWMFENLVRCNHGHYESVYIRLDKPGVLAHIDCCGGLKVGKGTVKPYTEYKIEWNK